MVGAAALLTACGGGDTVETDTSGARGSLMANPPLRVTALSAAEFKDRLGATASGQSLLALAGAPKCGVSVHYIEYGTVGGASEKTNASGALMVPTGDAAGCSGARPVVLYAHGTDANRA